MNADRPVVADHPELDYVVQPYALEADVILDSGSRKADLDMRLEDGGTRLCYPVNGKPVMDIPLKYPGPGPIPFDLYAREDGGAPWQIDENLLTPLRP
jgi:hypothetical protein